MVGGLPWWLGRCWASFENGGEAMLVGLGCGGEGSGGLVELFGGVVGGGDLVVGVVERQPSDIRLDELGTNV